MAGRVFVVSELYYPEETSTGHLLTQTAEGMARTLPVHVICSQPTYSGRGVRAPRLESRNGVTIERTRGTTLDKDSLWRRALNAATISASIVFRALRRIRRGDVVMVVTNPPFLPFGIAAACRLRGARCALLIHDVYPEVLTAAGLASPRSLVPRLTAAATRWLYAHADRIIVLGRDMGTLAESKLADGRERIVLIPNWADDHIGPTPRGENALLAELGLSRSLVIQYAGNMGRTHGLETLVAAARRIEDPAVRWLYIGSGAKREWLVAQARDIPAITVLGNRPRSEQSLFLNACDVAVISFVPGMAGVSVPSRMYNIMAAGKPIIAVADPESELALVVSEERIGWVVPPGDVDRLVSLIAEIRTDPALVAEYGARASQVARAKYSLHHSTEKYVRLMRDLLSA